MNIAHIEECSYIYGPGSRYVIWTQGCSIRCKGCWNSSMWDFSPKLNKSVAELFTQINISINFIEGITLLGGEPLDQYEETLKLLRLCKKNSLSTMLFTGYGMDKKNQKNMANVINYLDILITGRYDETKRTLQHQWIGSTNQEIHFVSDKYKDYKVKDANYSEISIDPNGSVTILGFLREI
jgi:anaerobic ribonucleoside-triphosphate reductase activating protein